MKAYTANELRVLVARAYARGLQDGRHMAKDAPTEPPSLMELIDHPYTGGVGRKAHRGHG